MTEDFECSSLRQTREEVKLEWEISDFSFSDAPILKSSVFFFSNSRWCMILYPNGTKESSDFLEVGLERKDSGGPKTLRISLGIKKTDGSEEHGIVDQKVLNKIDITVIGPLRFMSKWNILKRFPQLVPSDVLTIICTLSTADSHSPEVSLYNRLWNLSQKLRMMLEEKKSADIVLKVDDCDFFAHRTILEGRCDYFEGMLGNGFQENGMGAAEIDDIEEDVFRCILTYLYTGEVEGLSRENVGKTYIAAERFGLLELMKFCVDYMKKNLSHELICDTVVIAIKYEELELEKHAVEYFVRHADEIFDSVAWEKLKEEDIYVVPKLLEKIIVNRMKPI